MISIAIERFDVFRPALIAIHRSKFLIGETGAIVHCQVLNANRIDLSGHQAPGFFAARQLFA